MKIYLKGGPRDGEIVEINNPTFSIQYPYYAPSSEPSRPVVEIAEHLKTKEMVDGMVVYQFNPPPEIIESLHVNDTGDLVTKYKAKK